MRVALIVNKVSQDRQKNLVEVAHLVDQAASSGAELMLLPEAALTGLINNDDPSHDLPLGETIPGPVTGALGALCRKHGIWLGVGLLEREDARLYDSAFLFDNQGCIVLKYKRIQPQWHSKSADPMIYCQGTEITKAVTPFGSCAFLICGDLFDDDIVNQFKALLPDWMLFPLARCFSDGSMDQHRWDTEELPDYLARVRMSETPTLMVNYLADAKLTDGNSFGGAFVVSASGKLIASYPLGKPGILFVDLDQHDIK